MVLGKPQTDPTLEWFLSHCHIHKYPSKSTLIHQGEKAETLYYIVKGSVAVLIKDEEGKEMILSYLNQGDFIGELGLFEEGQERSAWVRAKTACEVAEISYKKFRQLIQVNPDILMRLSAQMARRLQVTSEKVGNLAFLDVTGRIAQTLLNLAKQPVCTDGASSASHFRESGQPGVPRRDGPHCTDSAESGKTTGCYDSPGRYANQNYPSGNRSDCRLFS